MTLSGSLPGRLPERQGGVGGNAHEVLVRRKKDKIVPDTELREERIDGSDLNPRATTAIAKLRSVGVILAVGGEER